MTYNHEASLGREAKPAVAFHEPLLNAQQAARFTAEIDALRIELRQGSGREDLLQLLKIERWGRVSGALGLATSLAGLNPLSVALIVFSKAVDFTIGHHVVHGGYDHVPGVPERLTSRGYARGARRIFDWFTFWRPTESWGPFHNGAHHGNTGDPNDADAVSPATFERLPKIARYAAVAFAAATWQLTAYPALFTRTRSDRERARRGQPPLPEGATGLLALRTPEVRETWVCDILPYALARFILLPLVCLPLGLGVALGVLGNLILAEIIHNLHGFLVNRPSHTGADVLTFSMPVKGKSEFYLRQIAGSVNYTTGRGDLWDVLHFFANHQIEHHVFMAMPMRRIQIAQPRVREIARRYGIPYVQDSVWRRLMSVIAVYVGDARPPAVKTLAPPRGVDSSS